MSIIRREIKARTTNTTKPKLYPFSCIISTINPIMGGITKPPNAPRPPIHPAAAPTASGTAFGTILKTPALTIPISIDIRTIPIKAKFKEVDVANIIIIAPITRMHNPIVVTSIPEILSARDPENTRTREPIIMNIAVRTRAMLNSKPSTLTVPIL